MNATPRIMIVCAERGDFEPPDWYMSEVVEPQALTGNQEKNCHFSLDILLAPWHNVSIMNYIKRSENQELRAKLVNVAAKIADLYLSGLTTAQLRRIVRKKRVPGLFGREFVLMRMKAYAILVERRKRR